MPAGEHSKMPLYVERSHDPSFAPPFLQGGCSLYGFPIRSSRDRVQAICDQLLNTASGGQVHYRAAAGVVFVYFCRFSCSRSYTGPDARRGFLGETELGIWLPVRRTHASGAGLSFFPYLMLVDSGPAMVTGREVYGFPKELGHMTLPDRPDEIEHFAADALVFRRHERSTAGRFGRLVEVRRLPRTRRPSRAERWIGSLVEGALRVRRGQTSFVLLKQVRDCADPGRAAYQAIVEARARVWQISRFAFLPDTFAVRFEDCDSHPVARELGLSAEALAEVRGIHVEMSFDLELGEVVWCAS